MTPKGKLVSLRSIFPCSPYTGNLCFSMGWSDPLTLWVPTWTSQPGNSGAQGKSKYESKEILYSKHSTFTVIHALFKTDAWEWKNQRRMSSNHSTMPWTQWKVNFSSESYQCLSVAKTSVKSKVDMSLILFVLVHIYKETEHVDKIFILT